MPRLAGCGQQHTSERGLNEALILALVLTTAVAADAESQEKTVPTKLFASAAEVDAALAKAKAEHKGDNTNTVEVLGSVGTYPVQLEYRTGATAPSMHKGQAELIYVMDGGCTLITGSTQVGMKGSGTTVSGIRIEGGVPHKVAKGDYIMVPPDTPHRYTGLEGRFVSVTLHMPMAATH